MNENDCKKTFNKIHDFKRKHEGSHEFICLYCGQKRAILDDGIVAILRIEGKVEK